MEIAVYLQDGMAARAFLEGDDLEVCGVYGKRPREVEPNGYVKPRKLAVAA